MKTKKAIKIVLTFFGWLFVLLIGLVPLAGQIIVPLALEEVFGKFKLMENLGIFLVTTVIQACLFWWWF